MQSDNLVPVECEIRKKRPTKRRQVNTLKQRQNGRHLPDDIFKCIFLDEDVWIPIKLSLKFVPKSPIKNTPALVQIMACRLVGAKLLYEPMMIKVATHICVIRPQWVNILALNYTTVFLLLISRHAMSNTETRFSAYGSQMCEHFNIHIGMRFLNSRVLLYKLWISWNLFKPKYHFKHINVAGNSLMKHVKINV